MLILAFFALFASVLAQDGCHDGPKPWKGVQYEVIVVGSGPAGLQASSSLGRTGRNILLVSDETYRNNATIEMHDVAALDGTWPWKFRALARSKLKKYPSIHYATATLVKFENVNNGQYFKAWDTKGKEYTARKILLATGVWDNLPKIPGLYEKDGSGVWGKAAYWCAYCDGYEHGHGGELAAILGDKNSEIVGDLLQLHKINPKATIFAEGAPVSREYIDSLDDNVPGSYDGAIASGIKFVEKRIRSVSYVHRGDIKKEGAPVRVTMQDGSSKIFSGLLVQTKPFLHSEGLVMTLLKPGDVNAKDNTIVVQDNGKTSAFGVFAAGDNMNPGRGVATALRAGKKAALAMVNNLAQEDALLAGGWDWRGTKNSSHRC